MYYHMLVDYLHRSHQIMEDLLQNNGKIGYSPIVLKGLIPAEHVGCWLLFVRACNLICSPFLILENVQSAHLFFVQFANCVKELESLTFNIFEGVPFVLWTSSYILVFLLRKVQRNPRLLPYK